MPTLFNGQLNQNEIFAGIYNMIISQQVFADNIKGTFSQLVDEARVDGGLQGDTKLYYDTDCLKSYPWQKDAEAANLLNTYRPADPKCQAITLNTFRQIPLTVDNYLSRRAFSTEGAFSEFNSVMLGWIRDSKKIYDSTLYNAYIGTVQGASNRANYEIDVTTAVGTATGTEAAQLEALAIAQGIADLIIEMNDVSRDFNDYKFLRSYSTDEIKVIWSSKYINKIKKFDLPTIFNNQGLVDKFAQYTLPARYFGVVITSSTIANYTAQTPAAGKPFATGGIYTPGASNANGTVRSLVEKEVTVSGTKHHVFPGDELPVSATVVASGNFEPGEVYFEKDDIIAKVVTKLPPMMSAFEVGTSFFNPKALLENHYLTWGHNSLEYLAGHPLITIHKE